MRFEDFITQSNSAKTPDELFEYLRKAVSNYGFDRVIFSVTFDGELPKDKNQLGIFHNYVESWDKYYKEKKYHLIDPVLRYAAMQTAPFKWSQLEKNFSLSPNQLKIFREGEEAGLWHGVGVPMRGSRGQLSGIALASSQKVDACEQNLDLIAAFCNQFYLAYKRFYIPSEKDEKGSFISLTPKETEVLHWLFNTKTDEEIATILGISKNTVDTHIRKIYEKMGVHNRIAAAIKGLMLGLIIP
ncbi:MAG: LuxR family transcriptional regulator [Alphaproteobacteria bacterium]